MADDADDDAEVLCANPDCSVAQDGKCVEDLDIESCPHYGHAPAQVADGDSKVGEEAVTDGVGLAGADTLTPQEAARLLRAGAARIIAIVSPTDAGKTSLIASLYDLFQEGSVAGIEFARSRSFHAFERACHHARAASRRNVPDMERTPRGEVRFYHLDVGGGEAGDALALALGDRSGEEYLEAADDASIVMSFPEVRRADSLTLLVDGERLLDAGARHNLRSELTMILQALIDGGAVKVGQRLALVLSKIDLVQASPDRARAENDFKEIHTHFERLFGRFFSTIKPFEVAASPKLDSLPRGTGVEHLLTFWLEPTVPPPTVPLPRPNFVRAFAKLRPLDEPEAEA